ncbi:MAG TPA: SIR2 family protein [Thermoanaerobaculia bacterium]|nr:SIR2 family protein [Thermoanaerobaculia bacterium]
MDAAEWFAARSPQDLTFLCGAGISLDAPASLPTVYRFLDALLEACDAPPDLAAQVLARASLPPVPRFEGLVEEIAKLNDREFSLARVFDARTFNTLHSSIAAFLERGSSVVTTNFDNCLERAAEGTAYERVIFRGRDLDAPPPSRQVLSKPHGSHPLHDDEPRSQLVVSIAAISLTNNAFALLPRWREHLRALFDDRIVVVAGYSGSDDFDLTPLLLESRPREVLWLAHDAVVPAEERDPASVPAAARFRSLPLRVLAGSTLDILTAAARRAGSAPAAGPPHRAASVRDYVSSRFPTPAARCELLHLVLLYFGLYDAVLRPVPYDAPGITVQRMKALFRLGRHDEVDAAMRSLPLDRMDVEAQYEARYFHSSSLSSMGRVEEAVNEAAAAVATAETLNPIARMNALNQLGGTCIQAGRVDDAERAFDRALLLQHERPHIAAEATTLWGLACVAAIRQELEWSLHLFLQARKAFEGLGDESNLAWCDYNCADACMNLDRTDEARAYVASAEAAFRRLQSVTGIVYVLWLRAKLHYRAEEYRQSETLLDELRAIATEQGGFLWLLEFVLLYNCVRARLGKPVDDFHGERFAARLRRLDRKHGRRLQRLLASPVARRIAAAEKWVFTPEEE